MLNIRRNCFETNSSSMHSLVVVKQPKNYTKEELMLNSYRGDSFSLFGYSEGSFSRSPFMVLKSPREKLQYYVAHEIGTCEKYELISVVKEFISKQTGIPVKKIDIRVNENEWRNPYDNDKNDYYGYVEHNDTGESPFDYIRRNKITMEDFILNPKYIIVVDGDEYQEFKKMFESHILNADDFEDISSGCDFWNDAIQTIYMNWISKNRMTDEELTDFITSMDSRTKYIEFYIMSDDEVVALKKKSIQDKIREILQTVKTTKSWVKSRLRCIVKTDLSKIEIASEFDEVILSDDEDDE